MNIRNLLTKIAFGISIAALIFSIVTLIRAIVLGGGILMACLLVFGTAIVVVICAIMLFVLRGYTDEADEDEAQPREKEQRPAPSSRRTGESAPAAKKTGESAPSSRRTGRYTARHGASEPPANKPYESEPSGSEPEKAAEEPAARSIEDEVDELISLLERENSYDLSKFE